MGSADREGYLSYVDGTLGVYGDAMRGYELTWPLPFVHIAELADQVALQVEDGNAVS